MQPEANVKKTQENEDNNRTRSGKIFSCKIALPMQSGYIYIEHPSDKPQKKVDTDWKTLEHEIKAAKDSTDTSSKEAEAILNIFCRWAKDLTREELFRYKFDSTPWKENRNALNQMIHFLEYRSLSYKHKDSGKTLAHYAIEIWDQPITKNLIRVFEGVGKGVELFFTGRDNNHETPYQIAKRKGFNDVIDALEACASYKKYKQSYITPTIDVASVQKLAGLFDIPLEEVANEMRGLVIDMNPFKEKYKRNPSIKDMEHAIADCLAIKHGKPPANGGSKTQFDV